MKNMQRIAKKVRHQPKGVRRMSYLPDYSRKSKMAATVVKNTNSANSGVKDMETQKERRRIE